MSEDVRAKIRTFNDGFVDGLLAFPKGLQMIVGLVRKSINK